MVVWGTVPNQTEVIEQLSVSNETHLKHRVSLRDWHSACGQIVQLLENKYWNSLFQQTLSLT